MMRTRTSLLLAAAGGLLAACAGASGVTERASVPAHAIGEGLGRSPQTTAAAPATASGHDHHTQGDRPHVH